MVEDGMSSVVLETAPDIKTTKKIYPQIYAYELVDVPDRVGMVKVGQTNRQNVEDRIKEQVKTAAVDYSDKCRILWSGPATKASVDGNGNAISEVFTDKQLHQYYQQKGLTQVKDSNGRLTEWFETDGETAKRLYHEFTEYIAGVTKAVVVDYTLRNEQNDAVLATLAAQKKGINEFLWNAKPRFGKTLATYDLMKKMNATNTLIVTNRPTIANSWHDDFTQFIGNPYVFVSESASLSPSNRVTRDEYFKACDVLTAQGEEPKQVAFLSLQDLKGSKYFGGTYDKLDWVKKTNWDLLVIDEAHEGVDTTKVDTAFDQLDRNFTLHLSGTPFKAIANDRFSDEQLYSWTYADEQQAKVTWDSSLGINPYESLPKLAMFTYKLSDMMIDKVNQGINLDDEHDINYMFDLNEFFAVKKNGTFEHEVEVKSFLDKLANGSKFPFATEELRNELKHTFWLLHRVAAAKALEKLLNEHEVFKDYTVILAAGDGKKHIVDDVDDIDDDISQTVVLSSLAKVREAIAANDKTITLSVGQLTTGVTIKEWSAVFMLSSMKSPSLYMQAAFRAQNPWRYVTETNEVYEKETAYVFDFAPARTLIIIDEFANNLGQTGLGGGRPRIDNIKTLLNFLPVIGEDANGQMIELDATKVMTIPKAIKATEVVRSGFMNNFLFQNVSGIFSNSGAKAILEKLNPEKQGKTTNPVSIEINESVADAVEPDGSIVVPSDVLQVNNAANFGPAVYEKQSSIIGDAVLDLDMSPNKVKSDAELIVDENVSFDALVENESLSKKDEARLKTQMAAKVERTLTKAKLDKSNAISYLEDDKADEIAEIMSDDSVVDKEDKIKDVEQMFAQKAVEVEREFDQRTNDALADTIETAKLDVITEIETKKVNKGKTRVEADVRSRLRGFARTIPSFLMAYADDTTTLANFEDNIAPDVFEEVTGITVDDFKALRDDYDFFDENVFNESIKVFLSKRKELANYFAVSQDEDIFDYIPPQQTNQIFTPRAVVTLMLDKMEEQDPNIFKDKDKTFVDLYVKSGIYLTEIVKRLFVNLADDIPDDDDRLQHILETQIYGFAPTEIIYNIAKRYIFGFDEIGEAIDQSHFVHLDTTPYAKGETDVDFETLCDELFGSK